MISSLNLTYIHLRLQELFGGEDWFGGINLLFVGDLLQLQPVNGNPVFEKMSYYISLDAWVPLISGMSV